MYTLQFIIKIIISALYLKNNDIECKGFEEPGIIKNDNNFFRVYAWLWQN